MLASLSRLSCADWANWGRALILSLVCLHLPACKHGEPYAHAESVNPHIVVQETPAKALPDKLVVQESPPVPPPASLNQSLLADAIPIVTQPPQITIAPATQSPSLQPVGYRPKESGIGLALDHYLNHRNDDAVAALKKFPSEDQEAALVMLPLLARMDQGETWTTMNGPQKLAYLESLRSLVRQLSKSAPLVMQNVILTENQVSKHGEAKPRKSNNYSPEEYVFTYVELVNLVDHVQKDGLYNIRLKVTLELIGADDKVYLNFTEPFQKVGSISSRKDYYLVSWFNLPRQLPPGSYQLFIHVLDLDTNRTTRQALPLQVLEPQQKGNAGKRRG